MIREIDDADDLSDDQKTTAKEALGKLLNVFFNTMRFRWLSGGICDDAQCQVHDRDGRKGE